MVRLRVVDEDGRSAEQRAQALHTARNGEPARARLTSILDALGRAQAQIERDLEAGQDPLAASELWTTLDLAYEHLDRYLAELLHEAAVDPTCAARCSACCTDVPPVLSVEALRMVRVLRHHERGQIYLQRAVDQARNFQKLLLERMRVRDEIDTSDPRYRRAQLAWRHLGYPCPVLDDEGNCSVYAARPLACRVHSHVEDAAHCEPRSPRFLHAERPPVWGHPREAEVELALATISRMLGLPSVPNLQWGLARLADY